MTMEMAQERSAKAAELRASKPQPVFKAIANSTDKPTCFLM